MPIVDALEVLTEEGRIKACDNRRGGANDPLIRWSPNGETHHSANEWEPPMKLYLVRDIY